MSGMKQCVLRVIIVALIILLIVCMGYLANIKLLKNTVYADTVETKTMSYDDYVDVSAFGSSVKLSADAQKIAEIVNGQIHAIDTGSAMIEVDGKDYILKVNPAKISLVLLIGQSNMEGTCESDYGNPSISYNNSLLCKKGMVYLTFGPGTDLSDTNKSARLTINNYNNFVPNSLIDNSLNNNDQKVNGLTDSTGKFGVDSGIAYEWSQRTGEKVWIVNAAEGGTSITTWQPGDSESDNNFWQAVKLYNACATKLQSEIDAGHYIPSQQCYFWLQGEADGNMSASDYEKYYNTMHIGLNKDIKKLTTKDGVNTNSNIEAGILSVRNITNCDANSISSIIMNGPRTAQYDLSHQLNNGINMVSNISDGWCKPTISESDAAVKKYFEDKYVNNANYQNANPSVGGTMTIPTTIDSVHRGVHYCQQGYDEIGRDAAYNMTAILYGTGNLNTNSLLGDNYNYKETSKLKLLASNGYTDLSDNSTFSSGDYVMPVLYPLYKNKITISTKNLSWDNGIITIANSKLNSDISFDCAGITKTMVNNVYNNIGNGWYTDSDGNLFLKNSDGTFDCAEKNSNGSYSIDNKEFIIYGNSVINVTDDTNYSFTDADKNMYIVYANQMLLAVKESDTVFKGFYDAQYYADVDNDDRLEAMIMNINGTYSYGGSTYIYDSVSKQFEKIHGVKYDLNGGVNNLLNLSIYTEGTDTVLAEPTRSGFNFAGWTDASGALVTSIPAASKSDITLNANWVSSKMTVSKATVGKKKVKVTWKKSANANSGYQISVNTKKRGSKVVGTVTNSGIITYTKTKLKKGKRYYVSVRAYQTVGGTTVYGGWSKIIKTAKVK